MLQQSTVWYSPCVDIVNAAMFVDAAGTATERALLVFWRPYLQVYEKRSNKSFQAPTKRNAHRMHIECQCHEPTGVRLYAAATCGSPAFTRRNASEDWGTRT